VSKPSYYFQKNSWSRLHAHAPSMDAPVCCSTRCKQQQHFLSNVCTANCVLADMWHDTCIHCTHLFYIRSCCHVCMIIRLYDHTHAQCSHTSIQDVECLIQQPVCMFTLQEPSSCRRQVDTGHENMHTFHTSTVHTFLTVTTSRSVWSTTS
jgi:hypothetical protein